MPAFYAKGNSFVFDGKAYSKAFNRAVEALFREAGRKFLQAALPSIPFRTGFVKGAFTVLEEALGGTYGANTKAGRDVQRLAQFQKKATHLGNLLTKNINKKLEALSEFPELATKIAGQKQRILARLAKIGARTEKILARNKNNIAFRLALTIHKSDLAGSITPEKSAKKQPTVANPKADLQKRRRTETRTSKFPGAPAAEQKESKEVIPRSVLEYYYPRGGKKVLKTLRSGRQFASFEVGEDQGKKRAVVLKNTFSSQSELQKGYVFKFKIDISYFNINDEHANRFTPSAPWKSFANGRQAFLEHMKSNLKVLPNVLSYLVESEITLTRSGLVSNKTKTLVV